MADAGDISTQNKNKISKSELKSKLLQLKTQNEYILKDHEYYSYKQDGFNKMDPVGPIALIELPGSHDFVKKVNKHLHNRRLLYLTESPSLAANSPGFLRDNYVIHSESVRFSSGEGKGVIVDTIRGHDCYIFCDVLNYSVAYQMFGKTVQMGPDDHFQDLIRMILATCDKTDRINVIMPFLYEGRQDLRTSRESLDCAYMLRQLNDLNVQNFFSFDPHDPRVENALPKRGIDNIPVSYQMIKSLCKQYKDLDFYSTKSTMVISPDEMGMKRAMFYATVLGIPLGTFYRKYEYTNDIDAKPSFEYLGDSPEGRDVIIVDDMIVSGNAMIETAKKLKSKKAKRVFCIASYLLAVDGIEEINEAVKAGYIDRVFASNLIYTPDEILEQEWYVQVDFTKFVALLIDAINHNASIAPLIDQTAKIKRLLAKYDQEQRFNALDK